MIERLTAPINGWPVWIRYMFLIGLFALITRTILDSGFRQSALLYILIPYLVAMAIYFFVPSPDDTTRWGNLWHQVIGALIVMLGTSAIIFEGFICVVMFLPIFILIVLIVAIIMAFTPPKKDRRSKLKSSFMPLIIGIASLEGVFQTTSMEREYSVTRTMIAHVSVAQIHANLERPIHLEAKRSRFLSLFPLPTRIDAGTFKTGDIHTAHFTYRRWGLKNFNSKDGETQIKLAEVSPLRVRTEIIKDTSYFATYLTIHGTEIDLQPISDSETEIKLTIRYRRDLDPAWYFGPLQRKALTESADYLIEHVIARDAEAAK